MSKVKKTPSHLALEDVGSDILQYWADSNVGGSGMGVSIQSMIKNMAREILRHRQTMQHLAELQTRMKSEINPGMKWSGELLRKILEEKSND